MHQISNRYLKWKQINSRKIKFNKRLTPAKVCKTTIVELDLYYVNTKFEESLRKWKTWHVAEGQIHSYALCPKHLTAKCLFETVDWTLKYDADKTVTTKVPWSIVVKSTILKISTDDLFKNVYTYISFSIRRSP